jgi:hypothetical protein
MKKLEIALSLIFLSCLIVLLVFQPVCHRVFTVLV